MRKAPKIPFIPRYSVKTAANIHKQTDTVLTPIDAARYFTASARILSTNHRPRVIIKATNNRTPMDEERDASLPFVLIIGMIIEKRIHPRKSLIIAAITTRLPTLVRMIFKSINTFTITDKAVMESAVPKNNAVTNLLV